MADIGKIYLDPMVLKRAAQLEGLEAGLPLKVNKIRGLHQDKPAAEKSKEIDSAARQFEALLLQQMMQSMWKSVPQDELFGSRDQELYRDMLNEALADSVAQGQGIGVRDVIAKELRERENMK